MDKLPNRVTSITFGYHFNKSVDKLPNSVTYIVFGDNFNKSVDTLPNSVTDITFGLYFNKSLSLLSIFIKTVCFNDVHNKRIYNNINMGVKKIIHNKKKINYYTEFTYIMLSKNKKIPYGCIFNTHEQKNIEYYSTYT